MPVDKGQDKIVMLKVLSSPVTFPLISAIFAKNALNAFLYKGLIHMKKS